MSNVTETGPLIMGASGQVGQMLYRLWDDGALDFGPKPPVWQVRRDTIRLKQGLHWDILKEEVPDIRPSAVICLAGGPHVETNSDLAEKAVQIAQEAPLLYASSQTVYGPQTGALTEQDECKPTGSYGLQKLAAEQALAPYDNAICLRIGNVVGADSLLRAAKECPVVLDQFPDGSGPFRMMIGMQTLGQAFIDLIACGTIEDRILNLAQPGITAMADLLGALGATWRWQPAPATAIPSLALDLAAVLRHIDLPPASPDQLVLEAKQAGWRMNG